MALALGVVLFLWGGAAALASAGSEFVVRSQSLRLTLDVDSEATTIFHTVEVTSLAAGARELAVPLPFMPAGMKAGPAGCPRGSQGMVAVPFQHRLVSGAAPTLEIHFDEPLARYQSCRLALEYTDVTGMLRAWVEGEERRAEVRLSLPGVASAKETAVQMELPRDWSVVEALPPARVQAGVRSVTVAWTLAEGGSREQQMLRLSVSSRPSEGPSFLPLLAALLGGGGFLSGVVVVLSRRDLRRVWREESRATRALGRLAAALRVSEAAVLALKNLSRRKARSVMTFLGIFLGGAILSVQAFSATLNLEAAGELGLQTHLYAMVAITVGVCFYCVASTMLNAVHQRRAEVGVMKAVGFGSGWVLRLFLLESLFLGLVAGGAGAALGLLVVAWPHLALRLPGSLFWVWASFAAGLAALFLMVSLARDRGQVLLGILLTLLLPALALASQLSWEWRLPLSPAAAALVYGATVGFVALICVGGGLYPAWRASRLYPMEALR